MAPLGFEDDEWLAAQYLLFLDETEDEAEAARRVEQLRKERDAQRAASASSPAPPPYPPPPPPPPMPAATVPTPGAWQRARAWFRAWFRAWSRIG